MGPITEADLNRYRTAIDKSLDAQATNTRTHLRFPCRVEDKGQLGLQGPSGFGASQWYITCPYHTDIFAGDSLVVDGMGTYFLTEMDAPHSYEVARTAVGVMTVRSGGAWAFGTNQTVSFRKQGDPNDLIANVGVQVWAAWQSAFLGSVALQYKWAVKWPSSLRFPSGTPVTVGDQIIWREIDTPDHSATLALPTRDFGLGTSSAFFVDLGGNISP